MSTTVSPGPALLCQSPGWAGWRPHDDLTALLRGRPVIVLTVWRPISSRLAIAGGYGAFGPVDAPSLDGDEQATAREVAEQGAACAQDRGLQAAARVEQATGPVWQKIVEVADEIDASLIVCDSHGDGELAGLLLGSTSHALLAHSGRPVLVLPLADVP